MYDQKMNWHAFMQAFLMFMLIQKRKGRRTVANDECCAFISC